MSFEFRFSLVLILGLLLSGCSAPTGALSGVPAAAAAKDRPFVNSQGMRFVPVPGTKVLMCTTETTLEQYRAFGGRHVDPGFVQGPRHPVVGVNWDAAKAYCAWLSKKEGRHYRLPTDAEWSAAAGSTTYPWGNAWPPPAHAGNYAGQELRTCTPAERAYLAKGYKLDDGFTLIGDFSDAHKFTAPVGSYPANSNGIHDLGGNVLEWCEDWHPSKAGSRILRGGSWSQDSRGDLVSAFRDGSDPYWAYDTAGFRVVLVP
ncbi:MAG: formylglycine-generating enzyme family protein [Prosthecobacter sp.]